MTEIAAPQRPLEKPKLIIDTNAFIKCLDLNTLSQTYDIYTSDMALYEIKDKKAKEKFSQLLFEVKTKYPSKNSLAFGKNHIFQLKNNYNFIKKLKILLKKLEISSVYQKLTWKSWQ